MAFTNQLEKKDWDEQVKYIQENITDEVIDEAFRIVPKEVNDATIIEIKETLKARRSNLQAISDRYFEVVNKFAVLRRLSLTFGFIFVIFPESSQIFGFNSFFGSKLFINSLSIKYKY